MTALEQQLSLDVLPDPHTLPGGIIIGKLRITGEFGVDRNLNRGEQLTVQVADADGQIVATALAGVVGVGFVNVTDGDDVIGTERQHKARLA